jgi:hypothetical protein
MKRLTLLALLVCGALALTATPAVAEEPGTVQPACADITDGSAFYHVQTDPTNTVTGTIFLAAPSCKDVTYTVTVSYLSGGKTKVKTYSVKGNGVDDFIRFTVPNVSSDDGVVCVSFSTSKGNNVYDLAPDSGCVPIAEDSGPAGSPFN